MGETNTSNMIQFPIETRTFTKGELSLTLQYNPRSHKIVGDTVHQGRHINAVHLLFREQGWSMANEVQDN